MKKHSTLLALFCTGLFAFLSGFQAAPPEKEPGKTRTDPRTGVEFRLIPRGAFEMGCRPKGNDRPCDADELPIHKVQVTRDFWLGTKEVTVAQFAKFVQETGYVTEGEKAGKSIVWVGEWRDQVGASWRKPYIAQQSDHPVVCVTWGDAMAYCKWAGYRLPTEAEWEYAARGGREYQAFIWGEGLRPDPGGVLYANLADMSGYARYNWQTLPGYSDGFAETSPVGKYRPNDFGLYDMIGNVWEWCADGKRLYDESLAVDPVGPEFSTRKAVRGGAWDSNILTSRLSQRGSSPKNKSAFNQGFRCAQ